MLVSYQSLFRATLAALLAALVPSCNGLASALSRRAAVAALVSSSSTMAANAVMILNDDGEYENVTDEDWQTAWKARLDKARTMTPDEVLMAARGAGNLDLKDGPESPAAQRRRAMAGCRDAQLRRKAGVAGAKECNSRVLTQGETEFMLRVMDGGN